MFTAPLATSCWRVNLWKLGCLGWGGVRMLTFMVHRSWYAADGYGYGVGMLTFMVHWSWYAADGYGVGMLTFMEHRSWYAAEEPP